MYQQNVRAPLDRIPFNAAGPLPLVGHGNRYLVMTMEYITNWPVSYAFPNQKAPTVAEHLVTNFFCHF
jgi:hypothetical protein